MTFDSTLNAVIPWIVGIIGLFLFYRALKEPLDHLGRLIKSAFSYIGGIGNRSSGDSRILTPNELDYE